jgi:hypothetical protein
MRFVVGGDRGAAVSRLEREGGAITISAEPAPHARTPGPTAQWSAPFAERGRWKRAALGLASLVLGAAAWMLPAAPHQTAAAATEERPAGADIKGEGKPIVFAMRRGMGDRIVRGFDRPRGDKIRLSGFGFTDFAAVARLMRQVGSDLLIALPGNQSLWVLATERATLNADAFQLELDRRDLVKTFGDEFSTFRCFAEGTEDGRKGGGIWRTNFGYAGPQDLGSRSLGSNGEKQVYVDRGFRGTSDKPLGLDPFRVENGVLDIVADRTPPDVKSQMWNYPYTSGLITSQYSHKQLYGVFEMRAKLPKGKGLWPAFWLLPIDHSWPPEIDILEVLGNDPTILHTNAHSKASGTHTDAPSVIPVPDTSADFHNYAVDWEQNEIRWYFDDVEVARAPTPPDMHKPMYMLVNLAVGGHWPGDPDASTRLPADLAIHWIRAYRHDATR